MALPDRAVSKEKEIAQKSKSNEIKSQMSDLIIEEPKLYSDTLGGILSSLILDDIVFLSRQKYHLLPAHFRAKVDLKNRLLPLYMLVLEGLPA